MLSNNNNNDDNNNFNNRNNNKKNDDSNIQSMEYNGLEMKVSGFTRKKSPKKSIVEPNQGENPIASFYHPYIDFQIERHVQDHSNDDTSYLFCIVRSKNYNVILFGYKKSWDVESIRPCPIDSYFLVLDRRWLEQTYIENDKIYQTEHREEMSYYEKLSYGIVMDNKKSGSDIDVISSSIKFKLNFLPDRPITIGRDTNNSNNSGASIIAQIIIAGQKSILKKVFIQTQDRFLGSPIITMVYLYGISMSDKKEITECVVL